MTTDVINGVPRSLLERCVLLAQDAMGLDFDEHAAIERDIRALLATAKPADHSEHDLNMVSQPAADGERGAICCEHSWEVAKDAAWAARSLNECKCDHNEYCDHCFPPDFRKGGKWHAGYQGAREDMAIWKRRALEAERKVIEQDRIIENLGNALNDENGPTFMGEPVLQASAAQPKQAVAVTDAETLRLALAELHKCGVKPGSLPHMVLTNLIDAAHKTGEEE